MRSAAIGLILLGAMLGISCGTVDPPPLKPGMTVLGADVRIGLTADDRTGEAPVMKGSGFQKLGENSYVISSAERLGSGELADGDNARATGHPLSPWVLQGRVFAQPSLSGARCDAQVVELTTSDLMVDGILPETRLVIDSELRAGIGANAVAIYKIEAELNYDGALMGKVERVYYLYGSAGGEMVEVFRGARGASGSARLATVRSGELYAVSDPSFYFKLGSGPHELVFSMSAHASSPLDEYAALAKLGGPSSLEATARLRVE